MSDENVLQRLIAIEESHKHHGEQIEQAHEHIRRLDVVINDLSERFGATATHEDVLRLHTKIDESVNGILRDALSAVPQKTLVIFSGIMVVVAIIQLVIALR